MASACHIMNADQQVMRHADLNACPAQVNGDNPGASELWSIDVATACSSKRSARNIVSEMFDVTFWIGRYGRIG
jgi:hypothetical protein